jgi:hypothetical protein
MKSAENHLAERDDYIKRYHHAASRERRRRCGILVASALKLASCVAALAVDTVVAQLSTSAAELRAWGEEALAVTDSDLWLADRKLYAERTPRRRRESLAPAFMWSAGVQLTALAAGSRAEPETPGERLNDYIQGLNAYWVLENDVAGYDVQPNPTAVDRYYDDNAWIVLALVEAFELKQDASLLDRADDTMKFVLSGEDDQLGGGIFWRERRRNSKNTCSNAPAVAGLLRLYTHRKRDDLLAAAERIHAWTMENLQADDGLMWDNLRLDGRLDRRKFSYNTAMAIRSCCLFHQITGEEKWLTEAQRMARAAEAHWVDAETGAIRDTGKFAHMLLEAFLAVRAADGDTHWLQVVDRSLKYLHDEVRDPNGRYPSRWDEPSERPVRSLALIDQASAARAFFVAAEAWPPAGDQTSAPASLP